MAAHVAARMTEFRLRLLFDRIHTLWWSAAINGDQTASAYWHAHYVRLHRLEVLSGH